MTSTTTTARPRGARRVSLEWIAPAILAVAALVLIVNLSRSIPSRETITIANPSGAVVTVRTTDGGRHGWLGLGTVDAKSEARMESVIDQGGVWRFQLTAGPDRVGELRRTADQLRATGWKITIPADLVNRLPASRRTP
jgi:hypothetical protein